MRALPAPYEPFHRATTGQRGAWWRLLVTIALGALGLFGIQVVLGLVYAVVMELATGSVPTGISPGMLLVVNLSLASLIVVARGLTRWPGGLHGRFVCSIDGRFRRGEVLAAAWRAAVVWAPIFVLGLAGLIISQQATVTGTTVAMLAVVWITQPLQCAGEEFLFRGALLQALGAARVPSWLACAVSAALFATAHLQFTPALWADRFVLGLAFAYVTLATGGVESAIALHCAVNLTGLTLSAFMNDVSQSLSPDVSEVGGTLWVAVVLHGVQLAIAVPWIVVAFRSRRAREEVAG